MVPGQDVAWDDPAPRPPALPPLWADPPRQRMTPNKSQQSPPSEPQEEQKKIWTAIRGYVAPTTEADALGVHSLDQFVLAVPDAAVAQEFYGLFGLDMRAKGNTLELKTFGHDTAGARWWRAPRPRRCIICRSAATPTTCRAEGAHRGQRRQADRPAARLREQRLLVPQPRGHADRGEGRAQSVARQQGQSEWYTVGPGLAGAPCARRRRRCARAGSRMCSPLRATSTPRSTSTRAISACACPTAPPTWSPSCTASTAATITCWRW